MYAPVLWFSTRIIDSLLSSSFLLLASGICLWHIELNTFRWFTDGCLRLDASSGTLLISFLYGTYLVYKQKSKQLHPKIILANSSASTCISPCSILSDFFFLLFHYVEEYKEQLPHDQQHVLHRILQISFMCIHHLHLVVEPWSFFQYSFWQAS